MTRRVTLTSLAVGTALCLGIGGASAKPQHSGEHRDAKAPPPPPVVARKVDPLDAALAQAMATTDLPRADKKANRPASRGRATGLRGLAESTRRARSVSLGARARSRSVPETEEVVRFDLQPLDQRVVSALITEKTAQLHYCHERASGPGVAPTGAVKLRFVIEPKGFVSKVEVFAGEGRGRELEACLGQRIRSWKFPAADAPTVVEYPLVFNLAGSTLGAASRN